MLYKAEKTPVWDPSFEFLEILSTQLPIFHLLMIVCITLYCPNVRDIHLVTSGTFGATLSYMVKDCDPATGLPDSDEGYNDTYMVRFTELERISAMDGLCFTDIMLLLMHFFFQLIIQKLNLIH